VSEKKRVERRYRRRRLAALFVVVACALCLAANARAEPETERYTVKPGDTLWSIATERYPPHADPRPAIEEIRRQNGLPGYEIRPGETLRLPDG
jgi:nucleoid-associated protein YgaU